MTPTAVIELGRQAVEVTLLVSAPLFIAALVTGLVISIFQAATQINEMTLSFVPKLIVVAICLAVFGGSIMILVADFTREIFARIPDIVR